MDESGEKGFGSSLSPGKIAKLFKFGESVIRPSTIKLLFGAQSRSDEIKVER
jgi:hypothetical protein